jgi:hypothetical protein
VSARFHLSITDARTDKGNLGSLPAHSAYVIHRKVCASAVLVARAMGDEANRATAVNHEP